MSYLGSLNGVGRVMLNNKEIGAAEYAISVYERNFLKEADGSIQASFDLIHEVFEGGSPATLILQDGSRVDFLVRRMNVGEDCADIAITGPIPGF